MKKTALFFSLFLPLTLSADPVEIDGIYYNLIPDTKAAEVTSTPNYYIGDMEIPETVVYDGIIYDVTSIGVAAFANCVNLISIVLHSNVTTIEGRAFEGCASLASVSLPNSLVYIGSSAFKGCQTLSSISIPDSVTTIENYAFCECSSLTSISLPQTIEVVKGYTFQGCKSLKSVTIPTGVTYIAAGSFWGCTELIHVDMPNTLTGIGHWAFGDCYRLPSIVIPDKVTSIGVQCFFGCAKLADVYCYAKNIPNTSSDSFEDSSINQATLHVPASSMDAYMSTNPWSSFGKIVALEGDTPLPQCAMPTISYRDGKLFLECETDEVEFVSHFSTPDSADVNGSEVLLPTVYTVTVYAKKDGYLNSDVITKNIDIRGLAGDANGDGEITIADITSILNTIIKNNP